MWRGKKRKNASAKLQIVYSEEVNEKVRGVEKYILGDDRAAEE